MFNLFSKKPKLPPEVERVFEKLKTFLENEDAQNNCYPGALRDLIIKGTSVDILDDQSTKELGRTINNPIPVNGPIGELLYLSSLRMPDDSYILFHRLGLLANNIDVYEIVSIDGRYWDILYLDMYHPRKSKIAPLNFKRSHNLAIFTGTNAYVPDFPRAIPEEISDCTKKILGIPLPRAEIRIQIAETNYSRPYEQVARINDLHHKGIKRGMN